MSTVAFIKDLVALLARIDHGMLEFEEPLPDEVERGIKDAVIGFGEAALPALHQTLQESWSSHSDLPHVIDVLGSIAHPSSIPYLIEQHRNHSSSMSGTAAIAALRKMQAPAGYDYIGGVLIRGGEGDATVFNTGHEAIVACAAMAEWDDPLALAALVQATNIRWPHGMPEAAIDAIARKKEGRLILLELAERDPTLRAAVGRVYAGSTVN